MSVRAFALAGLIGGVLLTGCRSALGPDVTEPVEFVGENASRLVSLRGRFDLLSYNVAGLPWGLSKSDPVINAPQMGPFLEGYDIVLLQEDFAYNEEIFKGRSHPYRSSSRQRWIFPLSDGLSHLSRLTMHEIRRVQWSENHGFFGSGWDELADKGFAVSRAWLSSTASVDFYNLHADAGRGADDAAARRAQFAQLAEHIKQHSAGRALIVAGDFNARWSDPRDAECLAEFLSATGLEDVFEKSEGPRRIDHIFYRSGSDVSLIPTDAGIDTRFRDQRRGAPLSDHPAVRARFEWTEDSNLM
jgi:endonuclease/exonuclease/phosphatase (EEP) superfamily protein YafD